MYIVLTIDNERLVYDSFRFILKGYGDKVIEAETGRVE